MNELTERMSEDLPEHPMNTVAGVVVYLHMLRATRAVMTEFAEMPSWWIAAVMDELHARVVDACGFEPPGCRESDYANGTDYEIGSDYENGSDEAMSMMH